MDLKRTLIDLQEALRALAARMAPEGKADELLKAEQALRDALAIVAEGRFVPARADIGGAAAAAGAPGALPAVLESTLDRVLGALGLEMGAVWLHPHRVKRGLPREAMEIGETAASAGLGIPGVQALPDWERVEKTHPELAPLGAVMGRLGIRASMAVSLEQEGRTGGLAVASPRPRTWTSAEVALMEITAHLLETTVRALRTERELRMANRALRVLGRCNQAVVRATDEAGLLTQVCRLLVEEGGYRLAWVGFAEQDAARTVRPVAQAGFEEGYLHTVNIRWDDSERGRGPTGTAIRTGQPAVVRNMLTDPTYAPWREEATRRGYASSVALPLTAGGKTFGALNVYAAEPDAFAPDEVDLLRRLADDLAFGIEALRTRTALRESEARYRNLVEQASDGIFLADAQGRFVDVNPAGCALLGYTRDEMLRLGIGDLVAPEELADQAVYLEKLRSGEIVFIERTLRRRDGSPVPVEISARMLDGGLVLGILRDLTRRKRMEEEIRSQAAANARLLEEARRRIKFVQALRNIDMAITGSLDLRVTFSVTLDEITAQLGLDAAAILLLDPHAWTLKYAAWRGFRTGAPERLRLRLGEGLAGRAALERRTVHVSFLPENARDSAQAALLEDEGFVTYYAVPLIAKGRLQGVLEVFHRSAFEPDGDWLQFLETLAGQAAIAIDNVALFDQLQRSHLELAMAYDETLEGWAHALDLRDRETEGHSRRVTEMTLRLARELGVKEEELVHVRRGALLHDIGKMGVPDAILLKPGPLTRRNGTSCTGTPSTPTSCSRPSPTCARPWTSPTATTRSGTARATRGG